MYEDAILKEVWRIKDEIAEQYGGDVHALAKALREAQEKGGRKVVRRPPKRVARQSSCPAKAE